MAIKQGSVKAKANRTVYKTGNKELVNRKIKLQRQLKLQPNNEQVVAALKDVKRRRHTPKNPFWGSSMIAVAKLYKKFAGKFDPKVFHPDPKVSQAALSAPGPIAMMPVSKKKPLWPIVSVQIKAPFSIAARTTGWV